MKTIHPISSLRRRMLKNPKSYMASVATFLLGLIVTTQLCEDIAHFFDRISRPSINMICLLLFSLQLISIASIVLLYDYLKLHKKHLEKYAPTGFDILAQEEHDLKFEKGWNSQP